MRFICDHCGVEFERKPDPHLRHFCTTQCSRAFHRVSRACLQCGDVFTTLKSKHYVYCSRACKGAARRTRVVVRCAHCGKESDRPASRMNRHSNEMFCSMRCRVDGSRIKRNCESCGTSFEIIRSLPYRFCSRLCGISHVSVAARSAQTQHYPHSALKDVEMYLTLKRATRKVEECLTQMKSKTRSTHA